jgi:hypothetical protein
LDDITDLDVFVEIVKKDSDAVMTVASPVKNWLGNSSV